MSFSIKSMMARACDLAAEAKLGLAFSSGGMSLGAYAFQKLSLEANTGTRPDFVTAAVAATLAGLLLNAAHQRLSSAVEEFGDNRNGDIEKSMRIALRKALLRLKSRAHLDSTTGSSVGIISSSSTEPLTPLSAPTISTRSVLPMTSRSSAAAGGRRWNRFFSVGIVPNRRGLPSPCRPP